MTDPRSVVLLVRSVTASLPRIKGLGLGIALIARQFRGRDIRVEVPVFANRMSLSTSDLIGNMLIFAPNYYDRIERKWLQSIVSPGDYVVDVGANIGAYTLMLASLVTSGGEVIAIEAEQRNADHLRENLALNGMDWVTVRQGGVSDKRETLSLLLNSSGNAGAHSFLEQSDTAAPPTQQIECTPLVDVIGKSRAPTFMKIDIEGFEHRVLAQYFKDAPRTSWPMYIMLEDLPDRREGDAVLLVTSRGYREIEREGHNVLLQKQDPLPR